MNEPLTLWDVVARVLTALAAGILIGWERESHGRPAGLRTTILACVASSIAMIISEALFIESAASGSAENWRPDPARLGAGILTGIGFLGAGTIIRHENLIRGVTTAASLWFVTVLGLAFGSGLFALGGLGAVIALATLYLLPTFEKRIPIDWYVTLTVVMNLNTLDEDEFRRRVATAGPSLRRLELDLDLATGRQTFTCELKMKRAEAFQFSKRIVTDFQQIPGVMQVKWI
jgi:putative Mg2+ transporter-C (MgtC) family protein